MILELGSVSGADDVLPCPYTAPIGCYSQGISAEDGAVDVVRDSWQEKCQESHKRRDVGQISLKDVLPRVSREGVLPRGVP